LFIDELGRQNPALFGMSAKGLTRLTGMSKLTMEDGNTYVPSFGMDYNYMTAVKRKLAVGSAIGLTSIVAKVGAMALSMAVAGSWLEEFFPKAQPYGEGTDAVDLGDADSYIGLGGAYSAGIEMAIGSMAMGALRDETELVSKGYLSNYEYQKYVKEAINSPTAFLFSTGIGSGYSNMLGSGLAFATNYGAHLLRDKAGNYNERVDKAFFGSNMAITNSIIKGLPYFSSVYELGTVVPSVYQGIEKGKAVSNPKILMNLLGKEDKNY